MLERSRYGTRSERLRGATLSDEQHAFVFDEIKTGLAAIEAELESTVRTSRNVRRVPAKASHLIWSGSRLSFEPEIPAGCEGLEKVQIGEDVSERLDVMRAKFRVIVTRRPTIRLPEFAHGVIQAPAPPHIIESGIPTEALLAQIAVSKYADGLPLYRQEAIYARDQVELDRSLMAQWMGKVGFELQPLADYVLERIKQGERVFADSRPRCRRWLPVRARPKRPGYGPMPVTTDPSAAPVRPWWPTGFEDSRSGDCVARHLKGYTGILQVDGYSAYTRLAKTGTGSGNETVTLAGCWAHLRRRFYELHINGSSRLATQTVTVMAALWKIEGDIRGLAPAARMAARQQRSAAIVAELFDLWEMELPRISGKSKLAEAIRYATSRRKALECFLIDGRAEMDSNIVERAIRPQTITRKNALFAGSDGGGRTWATIAHPPADRENERRRSASLARGDAPAHCRRLAHLPDRKTHAVELQDLNGLSFALTVNHAQRTLSVTGFKQSEFGQGDCKIFRS